MDPHIPVLNRNEFEFQFYVVNNTLQKLINGTISITNEYGIYEADVHPKDYNSAIEEWFSFALDSSFDYRNPTNEMSKLTRNLFSFIVGLRLKGCLSGEVNMVFNRFDEIIYRPDSSA
jgi:hypothetical protein